MVMSPAQAGYPHQLLQTHRRHGAKVVANVLNESRSFNACWEEELAERMRRPHPPDAPGRWLKKSSRPPRVTAMWTLIQQSAGMFFLFRP